jgi:hypothetical protein
LVVGERDVRVGGEGGGDGVRGDIGDALRVEVRV